MIELVLSTIKYTAIFMSILYAYSKLLHIKLKIWDLFDIPIFIVFSAVLSIITVFIKLLVPIGFLIFGIIFLFLRFKRTFYETITVGTIALGISIVLMVPAFIVGYLSALAMFPVKVDAVRELIRVIIIDIIQIVGIIFLFKNRRLQSGLYPKSRNATFDMLLYLSVTCIFTMMLLYAEDVKVYMLKFVLLVIALCGLMLIIWWHRHITYNYREVMDQQNFNLLEDTIEENKYNSAGNDYRVAIHDKLIHNLNKIIPACAVLVERAAEQTGNADICAARDMLNGVMTKMNVANEKCSFKNIPQTGVREIDASIIKLYTAAEQKRLTVSAEISAEVESWFADGKLDKDDIHTLFSYLCDNAVISALGSPDAKVRVELNATADRMPLIRIFDSGEQFDEGVLEKLGLEQITTRAGTDGHGIGLLTVFEILAKYGASFMLDEAPQSFGFTKCIEIAFDGRCAVFVRTYRESVVEACAARKGITVELIDFDGEYLRDGTNG